MTKLKQAVDEFEQAIDELVKEGKIERVILKNGKNGFRIVSQQPPINNDTHH